MDGCLLHKPLFGNYKQSNTTMSSFKQHNTTTRESATPIATACDIKKSVTTSSKWAQTSRGITLQTELCDCKQKYISSKKRSSSSTQLASNTILTGVQSTTKSNYKQNQLDWSTKHNHGQLQATPSWLEYKAQHLSTGIQSTTKDNYKHLQSKYSSCNKTHPQAKLN